MKRILAIYRDQSRAKRALRELENVGIAPERISILSANSASGQLFMASERNAAADSAITGAAVGSTGALLAGTALGAGALLVGPITLALVGGAAGGLLGGLIGLGIPQNEASIRSEQILEGAILVAADLASADEEVTAKQTLVATDYLKVLALDEPAVPAKTAQS